MVNPLLLPPLTTLISSRAMFWYTLVVSTIVGHGTTAQVVQPQQKLKTVIVEPDEVAGMDMSLPQPSTSTLLCATQDSPTSTCTSRNQPEAFTTGDTGKNGINYIIHIFLYKMPL